MPAKKRVSGKGDGSYKMKIERALPDPPPKRKPEVKNPKSPAVTKRGRRGR